jgi:hypothetical protein
LIAVGFVDGDLDGVKVAVADARLDALVAKGWTVMQMSGRHDARGAYVLLERDVPELQK